MHEMNFREHWKTIRLEEIADVRAGSAFPIKYQGNIEGKYPFYKVSDMNLTGNETSMHASNNWVEEDTVKTLKAKLFSKDTVIFPKVGAAVHTNKKRMLSLKSLVDNNVMGVTIRDYDLCIPYYLLYWFEFIDLGDLSNPGPLPAITATTVKNTTIPLPPLSEQRAIAHVLQTIQEAKFTRQREIALEHERKAALMDNLFSHGTKDEPRKQTEIGEIPKSWEVVRLKEIADLRRENVKPEDNQNLNFVGLEHIDSGESILKRWGDASAMKSAKNRFYPDDVLYGKLRAYLDKAFIAEMEGICSTDILVFTANPKTCPRFLVYLLHTEAFLNHAVATSTGISHPRTSWDSLGKFTLALPPRPEQRAIAAVFQAIDEKIATLEREAQHLDELFHAMLDELMTGQRSAVPLIDALK
ncbi:MAG: restriction endonuclease subunit S [Candidatus Poribacteria bacterium]|nr:restriction endonuclease subunit S [Candidatus Poribacteria bacterium]